MSNVRAAATASSRSSPTIWDLLASALSQEAAPGRSVEQFPLIRDASKCIKCMRCVQVCDKIQGAAHLGCRQAPAREPQWTYRSSRKHQGSPTVRLLRPVHHPLSRSARCDERDDTDHAVPDARQTRSASTVVQVAPAVRAAWGGVLRPRAGAGHAGASGLPRCVELGFDYVFDTNFSADLTIMEEGSEFLARACTHRGRVCLADVHLLLPRLGAVRQGPVSRSCRSTCPRQNPRSRCSARWSPRATLPKRSASTRKTYACHLRHAVHVQKGGSRASDDARCLRRSGCGRGYRRARARAACSAAR